MKVKLKLKLTKAQWAALDEEGVGLFNSLPPSTGIRPKTPSSPEEQHKLWKWLAELAIPGNPPPTRHKDIIKGLLQDILSKRYKFEWISVPVEELEKVKGHSLRASDLATARRVNLKVEEDPWIDPSVITPELWQWIIAAWRGDRPRVRICPGCERAFVAKDLRQIFCAESCRRRYYRQERRKERISNKGGATA